MDPQEIQETISRYNKRLIEFGISEKALGWGDKGRSNLRFEILVSEFKLSESTILDFGCGFGNLYDFIYSKGCELKGYYGIDINNRLIEIAKKKNRKNAIFYCLDLLKDNKDFFVDYSFSSGVFNHLLKDNYGFIKAVLDKLDKISGKGFAVNFLSDKVDFKYDYTFHANPGKILEMGYQYSNNIILKNNYMPYEFTIIINKHSCINTELTVYEEFIEYV